jgi:phosphatidylserine/phosphatidylglycerophosphate/cardiolipin synthase-like enzyme
VSAAAAVRQLLTRLSDEQVEALARACDGLTSPPGELGSVVAGGGPAAAQDVAALVSAWRAAGGMTGDGVALALRVGLAARRAADTRAAKPVWTGPGANGEQRLTAGVLHELIDGARERVLLVSYAAYTLREVAFDLSTAVDRGCSVDVLFETEEDSEGEYHGPGAAAYAEIEGITRWRWPAGARPESGAALHAKVLVVDGRRALVGSANLTPRALGRNLEAGVLINDPDVAAALDAHVRTLMAQGLLVRSNA